MKNKTLKASDLQVDVDSREVVATISTATIDRDREIVLPRGLVKKAYQGNPVVLYGHDHEQLPIGTTRWIKAQDNRLVAKYYVSDKTQFAQDVFGLLQDGVLRAHSIGADVLEASAPTPREIKANPDWAEARNVWRKWELLEFSVCAVPVNPEALALAVAKGYSKETFAKLGKAFSVPKQCWEWQEEEKPAEKTYSMPSWSVSWDDVCEKLNSMALPDKDEVFAKLRGKA